MSSNGRLNGRALLQKVRPRTLNGTNQCIDIFLDKRHEFLVLFYGHHTLLTLCSEALHDALNTRTSAREVDLQAIWCGYNAALDVLRLVADQSNAAFLYFVQDSVHVMIAYAAVLLVKVRSQQLATVWQWLTSLEQILLSTSKAVCREIEPAGLTTLKSLLAALTAQVAPANSGCALQAMFIGNLISMLEEFRHGQIRPIPAAPAMSEHQSNLRAHQGTTSSSVDQASTAERGDGSREELPASSQVSADAPQANLESSNLGLFDDQMWADVFATAGFSVVDGMFLPEFTTS